MIFALVKSFKTITCPYKPKYPINILNRQTVTVDFMLGIVTCNIFFHLPPPSISHASYRLFGTSLNAAAKIKERENGREIDTGAESAKRKNTGVDLTLIIGMAVIFFCSGTMYLCVSRIKTLKGKAGAQEAPDEGRSRTLKKAERKKSSSHKRKTKKTGKWMWKKQSVRDKQR